MTPKKLSTCLYNFFLVEMKEVINNYHNTFVFGIKNIVVKLII